MTEKNEITIMKRRGRGIRYSMIRLTAGNTMTCDAPSPTHLL